jgi:uncharacterized membrane protein
VAGAVTDLGIDDRFMKELGESLPQDGAALFVLVRKVTPQGHPAHQRLRRPRHPELAERRVRQRLQEALAASGAEGSGGDDEPST